jgi:Raf kinase inhibitor-like YbhB/YbcL family protein
MKGVMDVTHWTFWNVPATSTSVAAGVKPDSSPDGIVQGKNIRNVNGYQPPCPPPGATPHHYIFEIYALDTKLDLPAGSPRADLLKAMDGHFWPIVKDEAWSCLSLRIITALPQRRRFATQALP